MPAAVAATVSIGYLPYLGVGRGVLGFLPEYIQEEGLRGGRRYYLLHLAERLGLHLPAAVYVVPAALALTALSAWICLRRQPRDELAGGALLLASAAVVAVTPRYAWYFAWLLPLAALRTSVPILLLGISSLLLYLVTPSTRVWIGALMYVPLLLFALSRWRTRRARCLTRAATSRPPATD